MCRRDDDHTIVRPDVVAFDCFEQGGQGDAGVRAGVEARAIGTSAGVGQFLLAEEIQNLATQAKDRKLDLADLKGGTFSITNVGMIGGEYATPIINYPEVAILATLKIADRPRIENGEVVIKTILPLCLSFDHRVVDGAEVGRFMNDLINYLENPSLLLIDAEPG